MNTRIRREVVKALVVAGRKDLARKVATGALSGDEKKRFAQIVKQMRGMGSGDAKVVVDERKGVAELGPFPNEKLANRAEDRLAALYGREDDDIEGPDVWSSQNPKEGTYTVHVSL